MGLIKFGRLVPLVRTSTRGFWGNGKPHKSYNLPLRQATYDDLMEPYGLYKDAYNAEKLRGNKMLAFGILCMTCTLTFIYNSGTLDPLIMPNLDNIMEETVPHWKYRDLTDRITVRPDEVAGEE